MTSTTQYTSKVSKKSSQYTFSVEEFKLLKDRVLMHLNKLAHVLVNFRFLAFRPKKDKKKEKNKSSDDEDDFVEGSGAVTPDIDDSKPYLVPLRPSDTNGGSSSGSKVSPNKVNCFCF